MFLSKKNNAKSLLAGKIKSARTVVYEQEEVLDKKANQVSLGISQSFEYFRAADSVTIATRPLLYFYGMLSLAKSLIVANKKEIYFENMKYHGLTQQLREPIDTALKDYVDKPKDWKMESEYAITRPGVAQHLTELMCGFQFPNDTIVTFKDILSVCPEIAQMFEFFYGEPSKTIYLYRYREISKDPYRLEICPAEKDEKEIFKRIPELVDDFELSPEVLHSQARILTSKSLVKFPEYLGIYSPPVGGRYIIGGLKYRVGSRYSSRYVDPIVVDYVAFFILSMCVRYKQDFWGDIVQGKESGVLGLIELYISAAKRRFPNAILNHLFGLNFSYGTPARLV
jgi:hypothetical protein